MAGVRLLAAAAVVGAALLTMSATAGGAGLGPVKTTPGFASALQTMAPDATYGGFVIFNGGTRASHATLLATHQLTATADFQSSVNAVYAVGTVADLRALTYESTAVKYLEEDRRLAYHGETGPWATRARVAQEAVSGGPFYDPSGRTLDGTGVGVAVIDSGVNGAHPDLEDRVAHNYKIVCSTPGLVDSETGLCFGALAYLDVGSTNSDLTSGHGTHVSGIVAGDGRMSTGPYPVAEAAPNVKGTFTGLAPGSTLFVYSTGEGLSILYAMEAWQHLYDNYDNLRPRIRVANHSFGENGGATYDPSSVEAAIVKKLVGKGITMAFSAGNSGGDGTTDTTSSYCDDPTPGVICVANYQDFDADSDPQGTGNRDASVSSDSSRGLQSNQSTWPDIAAPGTWITAACIRGAEAVCASGVVDEIRWAPFYGTISGTSMASPHVAGIAALLTQAKPDITPAKIEEVLEDTAHKLTAGAPYVADAQNSNATTSVDKGAGLADVPRALKALAVRSAGGSGGGVKQGTPTIAIGTPAAAARMPVPGFTASGTASDGSTVTAPPVQRILDGDGGDYSQVGAADIVALSVQETLGGSGLTYRLTVRDASDLGPTGSVSYRVWQNVNGLPFQTNLVLSSAGAAPGTGTAVATSASLSGNTITFVIPYTKVGKPPAGSPVHNVQMASYVGVIQDYAPSPNPSAGIELNTRPMFGKPFTVWRPAGKSAAATVKVQVDSAAPVAATLTGSSPSYGWSAAVGRLTRGTHTLKATLYLGGVEKATATTSFVAR
jgi:serine protease AprX